MTKWIAVALLVAAPALAAAPSNGDVTGTWTISGDVSGVSITETCTLTQQDTVLTGSCDTNTGKYDTKGKIDGATATFTHGGKYDGNDLVMVYTGKLGSDGTITGTIDVAPYNVTGSFTAKKGPAAGPAPAPAAQ